MPTGSSCPHPPPASSLPASRMRALPCLPPSACALPAPLLAQLHFTCHNPPHPFFLTQPSPLFHSFLSSPSPPCRCVLATQCPSHRPSCLSPSIHHPSHNPAPRIALFAFLTPLATTSTTPQHCVMPTAHRQAPRPQHTPCAGCCISAVPLPSLPCAKINPCPALVWGTLPLSAHLMPPTTRLHGCCILLQPTAPHAHTFFAAPSREIAGLPCRPQRACFTHALFSGPSCTNPSQINLPCRTPAHTKPLVALSAALACCYMKSLLGNGARRWFVAAAAALPARCLLLLLRADGLQLLCVHSAQHRSNRFVNFL